jgi:hypothetical protein
MKNGITSCPTYLFNSPLSYAPPKLDRDLMIIRLSIVDLWNAVLRKIHLSVCISKEFE